MAKYRMAVLSVSIVDSITYPIKLTTAAAAMWKPLSRKKSEDLHQATRKTAPVSAGATVN